MSNSNNPSSERSWRIAIYGSPGSGKSTVADQLGSILGVPAIHLDDIYHGLFWQSLDDETFKKR